MEAASPCCNCNFKYIPTPSGEPSEYECLDCKNIFFDEVYVMTEKEIKLIVMNLKKAKSFKGMERILIENFNVYDPDFDSE